jgi:hypothetical protein
VSWPFGFTPPLSVAPESEGLVAGDVVAVGGEAAVANPTQTAAIAITATADRTMRDVRMTPPLVVVVQ